MNKIKVFFTNSLILLLGIQLSLANTVYSQTTQNQNIEDLQEDFSPKTKDLEYKERSNSAGKFFFKTLPRDIAGSTKESFWGWGGLAFILGSGLSAGIHPLDDNIQDSFDKGNLFGDTGNDIIGWGLSPYSLGGISIATWIIGYKTEKPKLELTGKALTEAMAISLSIAAVGKLAFRRERPNGDNFSFPSGHSTAAFSSAGVLTTFYGWKAGIPSYALATLVGISRIDDDKHFLSDVLMGAVIGTVVGVGTALYHKKKNPHLFLAPQITSEKAGMSLIYVF